MYMQDIGKITLKHQWINIETNKFILISVGLMVKCNAIYFTHSMNLCLLYAVSMFDKNIIL